MFRILLSSLSRPTILWPRLARHAAVTQPTYPNPRTATLETPSDSRIHTFYRPRAKINCIRREAPQVDCPEVEKGRKPRSKPTFVPSKLLQRTEFQLQRRDILLPGHSVEVNDNSATPNPLSRTRLRMDLAGHTDGELMYRRHKIRWGHRICWGWWKCRTAACGSLKPRFRGQSVSD